MSLTDVLSFAAENRPPYFTPDIDIEVFDPDEEEWDSLRESSYSLESLIDGLAQGQVEQSHIRFAQEEVEQYLNHLIETGIDEKLHHEQLMNRSRLVAFADAGYTSTEDFLGTADPIDISRETGVDRDVVTEIATNHVSGFSTAGSFGGGPLDSLEPRDDFEGWRLTVNSDNRIRWVSDGGFRITVTPGPDGSISVTGNTPDEERHPWYRKGWSPAIGPDEKLEPDEALDRAHEWLENHQLSFEDDLATVRQIGPATKDYLALEYDVTSFDGLHSFVDERPEEFENMFGELGEEVRDDL